MIKFNFLCHNYNFLIHLTVIMRSNQYHDSLNILPLTYYFNFVMISHNYDLACQNVDCHNVEFVSHYESS